MSARGLRHRHPLVGMAARSRTRAGRTSSASARCATPIVGAGCRAVRVRCGLRRVDRRTGVGIACVDRGAGVVGVAPDAHAQLQLRLRTAAAAAALRTAESRSLCERREEEGARLMPGAYSRDLAFPELGRPRTFDAACARPLAATHSPTSHRASFATSESSLFHLAVSLFVSSPSPCHQPHRSPSEMHSYGEVRLRYRLVNPIATRRERIASSRSS